MENDNSGSFYNFLPEGCGLCYKGAKMVLFVTGICGKNCFYCPVSNERREKDIIYANERCVNRDEDLIEEAISMDALGTGITGGEPLLRLDRVIHYIKLLKNKFGKSHHIHLYTALAPNKGIIESLKKAGLDELRFHPPQNLLQNIDKTYYRVSITEAYKLGLSVGIEIPSITCDLGGVISLLKEVDGFLNLNELEFSETNFSQLKERGYVTVEDTSSAALGSREVAQVLDYDKLHFCSSRFKDAVQLRERFKRIAKRSARYFDEITDDGTLVYGVIEGSCAGLLKEAGVQGEMFDVKDGTVEIAWWIAEDLAGELKKIGYDVSVIERYPMKNGMIAERTPL
ncbi:MAG TPA: radical SAM protein [Candidatus Methanoperedens sp.]